MPRYNLILNLPGFTIGKVSGYQRRYRLEHQELLNRPCPQVLGIDEHFFSKKEGFATTL